MLNLWRRRSPARSGPRLSFIVIAYDMQREVCRTVRSLARAYQQGAEEVDYEVIVVDNGSPQPLDLTPVGDIGVPLKVHWLSEAGPSPVEAINYGVAQSTGDYVAVMIDGARMLTPGVVKAMAGATRLAPEPVLAVLGLHIGPAHQRETVEYGYSKAVEDELLDSIEWPADGYRLFEIGAWGGSCPKGWFGNASESNCIGVSRRLFDRLGGFDPGFAMPGGGLANLDFYKRAVEYEHSTLVYLMGEGCFHQLHGGVTTGKRDAGHSFDELDEEYRRLRGEGFSRPTVPPVLYGRSHPSLAPAVVSAASHVMKVNDQVSASRYCEPFLQAAQCQPGEES